MKPSLHKTTNGVNWYLVTGPENAPSTPKGSPRKCPPGIYLEAIKGRDLERQEKT